MNYKYPSGILLGLLIIIFGCGSDTSNTSSETPRQPENWSIVSTIPSLGNGVVKIQIHNNIAYVAFLNGVKMVNVIDPYRPSIIGTINPPYSAPTLNIAVTDNIACIAEGPYNGAGWLIGLPGAGTLRFYDITNPNAPTFLSYLDIGAADIIADGNKIYASRIDLNSLTGASLSIIDFSDPHHPSVIGTTPIDASGHLAKSGNILFISYSDIMHYKNIQAVDISNPSTPVPIVVNGDGWVNVSNVSLSLWNSVGYVPDGTYGIHVIDLSNPAAPSIARTIPAVVPSNNVAVSNGYLYVANGSADVEIFDIGNPLNPIFVKSINTDLPASYVSVQDGVGIVVMQDQSISCFFANVFNN